MATTSKATIAVKTVFEQDTRRLMFVVEDGSDQDMYERLCVMIRDMYSMDAGTPLVLKYRDDEDDLITVTSSNELHEAFEFLAEFQKRSLRLFVSLEDEPDDGVDVSWVDVESTTTMSTNSFIDNMSKPVTPNASIVVPLMSNNLSVSQTNSANSPKQQQQEPQALTPQVPEDAGSASRVEDVLGLTPQTSEDILGVLQQWQVQPQQAVDAPVVVEEEANEEPVSQQSSTPQVPQWQQQSDETQKIIDELSRKNEEANEEPLAQEEQQEEEEEEVNGEPFPDKDAILAGLTSFFETEVCRNAVKNMLPLIRDGVVHNWDVETIVEMAIGSDVAVEQHPVVQLLRPHMALILKHARIVLPWTVDDAIRHIALADALLLREPAEFNISGVYDLVSQAVQRGQPLEVDVFEERPVVVDDNEPQEPQEREEPQEPEEVVVANHEEDGDDNNNNGSFVINHSELLEMVQAPREVVVHTGVTCDECGVNPIEGVRYKCMRCPNYDLCQACEDKGVHDDSHCMIKMKKQVDLGPYRVLKPWKPPTPKQLGLRAEFVADANLPDGSVCEKGAIVTKTWVIRNTGDQAWPQGTQLVFLSGNIVLADPNACVPVPQAAPNEAVEVSVRVKLPMVVGKHTGNFRLAMPTGKRFGRRLWLCVNVVEPAQPVGPYADQLVTLRGMGFDNERSNMYMLRQYNGDLQRVIEWYLSGNNRVAQ